MVARRPVVSVSGLRTELPPGDTIVGGSPGTLIAGSGLDDDGGGNLGEDVEVDVSTTPSPSGLIIVDNKLGDDGVALRLAESALASGNQAIELASTALASGNASIPLAATALASGNAALLAISNTPGGTEAEFTAASAIDVGYAVGLDDNYKVQAIRNVQISDTNPVTYSASPAAVRATINQPWITYVPLRDKYLQVWRRNMGNYEGQAMQLNVNQTTGALTTWGSSVDYHGNFSDGNYVITIPGTDKTLVAYRNGQGGSDDLRVVVITLDANTLLYVGTYANVTSGSSAYHVILGYDSNRDEFIVNYSYNSTGVQHYKIGSVSGTTITLQAEQSSPFTGGIEGGATARITDLGSSKIMFTQRDTDNSNYGTCVIGTNGGTSITWGSKYIFESNSTNALDVSYDSANSKALIVYRPGAGANQDDGVAKVATISGTTVSFGTLGVFSTNIAVATYTTTFYDSAIERHVITFIDGDSSNYPKTKCAIVTGTSVSFETASTVSSVSVTYAQAAYNLSANQNVVTYINSNDMDGLGSTPLLATEQAPKIGSQNNFIGIAKTAAASGSAVTVGLPGAAQSVYTGLVVGSGYYVDPTSSGISTSSTAPANWSGGLAWQRIGRAVSSTDLYLTDTL